MNGIIIGAICFVVGSWFGFGVCAVLSVGRESRRNTELQMEREEKTMVDRCVCCGAVIPEGRQVCPSCEEAAKRGSGCEYCSGRFAEYQHTVNTKLYINTFGRARTIETECNPCPPFSQCCMKGIPARSAFIINYCPNCGRNLCGGAEDGTA